MTADKTKQEIDIAEDSFIGTWHPVLRWFLLLPAAIVAAFIAGLVLYLGNQYAINYVGLRPETLRYELFMWFSEILRTGAFFGVFVYVGALFAPSYQLVIGIVFTILATIFVTLGFMGNLAEGGSSLITIFAGSLAGLGGAGFALYSIHENSTH